MFRNYDDPLYKKWRIDIYKRDKFKCQWPGCSASKKLNAHHIKRWADCPGLRYDVNNGITLCKDHHKSITGLETYYESVFLKIIANNNDNNRT
jgi:hypothetical protein